MEYVPLLGRFFYSLIFILASVGHFMQGGMDYAVQAGVPMPQFIVPVFGVISLVGGLSILLGYQAKLGAWLLVLFLVSVTFVVHDFWAATDPQIALIQRGMFFKNLSMIGGALYIAYFGPGPYTLSNLLHKKRGRS